MRRHRMHPVVLVAMLVSMAGNPRLSAQDVTAEQVRRAIKHGSEYLKTQQNKTRGNWPEHPGQPGGLTALCALALLTAGEPVDSPEMQATLTYLRSIGEPNRTYATALQTMVFCAAEPERDRFLISRNARWLESTQIKDGPAAGMWGYATGEGHGDSSNTQFALLGLYEAERAGVDIDPQVWQRSLAYYQRTQRDDGTWAYFEQEPPLPSSGSMTCAGVGSLLICADRLGLREASVEGGRVACCGNQIRDDQIEKSLEWLGRHGVTSNPGQEAWHLYYLYGIERVGRLSGRRFLGRLDWYRTGAAFLVARQDTLNGQWRGSGIMESNPVLATAFSLLFLAKGRRPVVISQLEWRDDDDWQRHPGAIHNLTRQVELRWKRDLAWQTIRLKYASVNELLETPVLFIRGTQALQLSPEQITNLKEYITQGGFLFVEACDGSGCQGEAFTASFKNLVGELVPDGRLRELPPEHPIWYAEERVNPKSLPEGMWLYGVDACCRTSIVFSNKTLSCYWELHSSRQTSYPEDVRQRIKAALDLGQNVLAYATNRELKEKLDRPQFREQDTEPRPERGTLAIAKISHTGGSDDAPHALANLLGVLRDQGEIPVNFERRHFAPTDLAIYEQPLLFLHGRRSFRFSPAERQALAEYLQRGGFIFGDAICASPQFAESVRREFEAMLPGSAFTTLPGDHPIYSQEYRGFAIDRVTIRDPQARVVGEPLNASLTQQAPILEALELDGRIAVIFSPLDMSCALENQPSLECKGYLKTDAARLGVNIILFGLGQ